MQALAAAENLRFNLWAALEATGLSQKALSEKAEISDVWLNRLLQGHSKATVDICEKLARALGLEADELIVHPEKFKKILEDRLTQPK